MPTSMSMGGPLFFRATQANKVCVFVFLVAGPTLLAGLMAYSALTSSFDTNATIIAIVFGVGWLLSVMLAMFLMSTRVELTTSQVTRQTLFGKKTLLISEMVSAMETSGGRGSLFLQIRTTTDRVMFGNLTFSNTQLGEMRDFIQARAHELGRQIQTSLPPPSARAIQGWMVFHILAITAIIVLAAVWGVTHHR